jgi:hypothetical protein
MMLSTWSSSGWSVAIGSENSIRHIGSRFNSTKHLAKLGRAPFLEAGPSFRAAGNLNGYNPSHFGVTAGGGGEARKGAVLLSTALRYTRWAKDGVPNYYQGYPDYSRTNVNAVELILGVGF